LLFYFVWYSYLCFVVVSMNICLILENSKAVKKELLTWLPSHRDLQYSSDYSWPDSEVIACVIRSTISIDQEFIDTYQSCKHVLRVGVWLDNVDQDLCQNNNIKVYNTPWANAQSVADLAIRWMLSLLRNTVRLHKDVHNWDVKERHTYMWRQAAQEKVWIMWFGAVWKEVYQRLVWFGAKDICVYDPFFDSVDAYPYVQKYDSLEKMSAVCTILFVHVPLNEKTKHLIDASFLSKVPSHTLVINLARGWIIDENALYSFLQSNPHAWAYCDVWEWEPEITQSIQNLLSCDNFLFSPHVGAMTHQAEQNMHTFKLD